MVERGKQRIEGAEGQGGGSPGRHDPDDGGAGLLGVLEVLERQAGLSHAGSAGEDETASTTFQQTTHLPELAGAPHQRPPSFHEGILAPRTPGTS